MVALEDTETTVSIHMILHASLWFIITISQHGDTHHNDGGLHHNVGDIHHYDGGTVYLFTWSKSGLNIFTNLDRLSAET